MSKRLVIKTVLICIGIFLIITSSAAAYIFNKYPIDFEKHITVVVAAVDIDEGQIIREKDLKTKEIQESASSELFATDKNHIAGRKASTGILRNEYVRTNILVDRNDWYKDDERIIILPVSMEERLANLITKGSYIDIRLSRDSHSQVETILYKIKVHDVLDDTGTPLSSKSGANSKTAYLKLILDSDQRRKIYSARLDGRLIYELYCDAAQKGE